METGPRHRSGLASPTQSWSGQTAPDRPALLCSSKHPAAWGPTRGPTQAEIALRSYTPWVAGPASRKGPHPHPSPSPRSRRPRTYAGGDGGAALLVAFGAAVAGDAGHAVLAGTLAGGLVAGFASSAHGVAIAGCGGHTTGGSEGGQGPVHTLPGGPPQGRAGSRGVGPATPTRSGSSEHWPPAHLEKGVKMRIHGLERMLWPQESEGEGPSQGPRGRRTVKHVSRNAKSDHGGGVRPGSRPFSRRACAFSFLHQPAPGPHTPLLTL